MSERARKRILVLAVAALGLGAIAIAVVAGGQADEGSGPGGARSSAASSEGERGLVDEEEVLAKLREHADHAADAGEAREIREVVGDPRDETDARDQELAAFEAARRRAEPVARRFFTAFAAYELGDRSPAVERALAETTTARFADELLGSPPPRLPSGATAPPRARLVALDFVPGVSGGARLLSLELVATVDRGGERTPLAIALRRAEAGWLVDALGR